VGRGDRDGRVESKASNEKEAFSAFSYLQRDFLFINGES